MKSASAGLIALLNGSATFLMADLLTLTTVTGAVYRYTDADIDLTYDGNVFSSRDIKFKRSRIRTIIGVEVDTLDLNVYADSSNLVGGLPFFQALASGALDGARVQLERVFMPSWGDTSNGTIILFIGRLSDIQVSRTEAKLSVKSDLELLNIELPRNLYGPGCWNTLFDSVCGLNKASFATTSTAASGSTTGVINCSLVQVAGYFDLGTLVWTSGANNGITRNVKSYIPGVITLSYPLPHVPLVGDAFTVYPGCDKQQATCSSKFNNLANFRGTPYVPKPETAI